MIEAEYTTNINIHAPMEPMNATAEIKDGNLHLYSGNQFMTRFDAIAAGAVGIESQRRRDAPVLDRRRLRPPAGLPT